MTVTQLDLSGYADDDEVPGYSTTAGELRKLPFVDALTDASSRTTASARFIEGQQRAVDRGEPKQDPRLRSGSSADQHRAAVAAAIRDLDYIELPAATLNRVAASIPLGMNVHAAVRDLGLPQKPVRTSSAATVVARRL